MAGTKKPAEIVLGASSRKLKQDLAKAKGEIKSFGKETAASIRGTVGTAFSAALGLASVGGATALTQQVLAQEKGLTRLAIAAEATDEQMLRLRESFNRISQATGVTKDVLGEGAAAIVTLTGDFELASSAAFGLARAAKASGADMTDLAGVAASLGQNLRVSGKDMGKAFDILAVQGGKGSVELKDLASLLPSLSAGFSAFGERGLKSVATMGAAIQIIKRVKGTSSEAATAMQALNNAFIQNATKIRKATGKDIFTRDAKGNKVLREYSKIISEIARSKVGRDPTKLIKMLGSDEAFQAFNALKDNAADFQALISAGLEGGGKIEKDFQRYLESPAGRIELAWTRAQNAMQSAITPDRVEKLAQATEHFASAIGFAVDHAMELVTLIGAVKLAQFSMATHKWATAMGGVSDKIRAGADGATAMGNSMSGMASKMGRVASAAGGILATFTASYDITTMLLDKLGVFEDKTLAKASADDMNAKAAEANVHVQNRLKNIERLRADLPAQQRNADQLAFYRPGSKEAKEAAERLAATKARLADDERMLPTERAQLTVDTIVQRDLARGTDAADDVLSALKEKQLREELGSRFPTTAPSADATTLHTFGREAENLSGQDLSRVIQLLEMQLTEAQKQRELLDRVRNTQFGGAGGAGLSAPETGRSPM